MWEPFLKAPLAIQIHMAAAVFAFILGAAILWRKKGDRLHRNGGKIWVGLMLVTALSGFFIHELKTWGNFSPIHIFSVITPISLFFAIRSARQGNIKAHRLNMQNLYIGGMIVAGGFTLLPGRLTYEMLFGKPDSYPISINMVIVSVFAATALAMILFNTFIQKTPSQPTNR